MYKSVLIALALTLSSTAAFAGNYDFNDYDANSDGNLTTDEFYGSVSDWGVYRDWDANDDGLIDENEWNDLDWDYTYTDWDADGDGYLDSGEFYDGVYSTYDADEDGHWSNSEWDDAGEAGLFDM